MASSGCHSVKVLSKTVDYSPVAMVTDLCRHLAYDKRGAWHTVYAVFSSQILSEMLPEIHKMEKYDFLMSVIHSELHLI